jgi:hypothetical protein
VPTTTTTEPSPFVSTGPNDGPTTTVPQGVGDSPGGVEDANASAHHGGTDPSTAPSDLAAPSGGTAPTDTSHVAPAAQLAFTGGLASPLIALGTALVLAGALIAFKARRGLA